MKVKFFITFIILCPIYLIGQISCVPEINVSSGQRFLYRSIPLNQINNDTIIIFLPNDTTKGIRHKNYARVCFDTLVTGIFKVYSTDSTRLKQIVSIKKGLNNGLLIDFFDNGSIKLKAEYFNGEEMGIYISFNEFGKIKREGINKNDRFIGKSYEYWNNHNLASETMYDGMTNWGQHKVNYWDKDGKVIDKITFDSLWYPCK